MKKTDYYGFIRLKANAYSPICIAGGEEEESDHDVIRNFDGEFFLPGTSLAGAFRAYCEEMIQKQVQLQKANDCLKQNTVKWKQQDVDQLFGYAQGEDSKESSFFVFDGEIKQAKRIIRDGIALSEDKITLETKKYTYEALDAGTEIVMEWVVKATLEEKERFLEMLRMITAGIHSGRVRLGHKKMRGMGELRISEVLLCEFEKGTDHAYGWQEFSWEKALNNRKKYSVKNVTAEWQTKRWEENQIQIVVPLKLRGGLSIRQYSAKIKEKDSDQIEADFQQIERTKEKDGKTYRCAVIPGSTWNGALRHQCKKVLQELGLSSSKAEQWIQEIFGYVKETEKEAYRSQIEVKESELSQDSEPVFMVRNRINRFEGGTMDGALYTELSYFGGDTNITLFIPDKETCYWAVGLLILVLKDIANGFFAIGGQTAIGRGIFCGTVNMEKEAYYLEKLASRIEEELS